MRYWENTSMAINHAPKHQQRLIFRAEQLKLSLIRHAYAAPQQT